MMEANTSHADRKVAKRLKQPLVSTLVELRAAFDQEAFNHCAWCNNSAWCRNAPRTYGGYEWVCEPCLSYT